MLADLRASGPNAALKRATTTPIRTPSHRSAVPNAEKHSPSRCCGRSRDVAAGQNDPICNLGLNARTSPGQRLDAVLPLPTSAPIAANTKIASMISVLIAIGENSGSK